MVSLIYAQSAETDVTSGPWWRWSKGRSVERSKGELMIMPFCFELAFVSISSYSSICCTFVDDEQSGGTTRTDRSMDGNISSRLTAPKAVG